LPTGFECGVLKSEIKPGDMVAIIGAGPIGLAALITAQFYSPAEIILVDTDPNRLDVAKTFGAAKVVQYNAVDEIMKLTLGKGVDVAIEAVGTPATFNICQSIVADGGHIANIGVHGKSVELHLEKLWAKSVTITTRLVDTATTPMLLKLITSGKLQPMKLITHHFVLNEIMKAYDIFGNAAKEKALKVVLTN
jgi:alcohol dehydrogenase